MADALVDWLNDHGYQPFAMSRTNVDPPDVLTVVGRDMEFWGRLHKFYMKEEGKQIPKFNSSSGRSDDIEYEHTSRKNIRLAVSCLESMLKCIGLTAVPKIDLSFCGESRLTFSVSGVTYRRVDPVDLDQFFQRFSQRNIPDAYVTQGALHVTYEYLYAERLLMQMESGKQFKADAEGDIGSYVDLGVNGEVKILDRTTLEFTSKNGDAAAFAFKSGRLLRADNKWEYFIHESALSGPEEHRQRPWIPARGELLDG